MPLGLLFMQTSFLGAIVVQMKELLKGNPMIDPAQEPGKLALKGLWQAGFAGLLGDVMFKDPDGYRRSLVAELAGPVLNVTGDAVLAGQGAIKAAFLADEEIDYNTIRRAMKPFVPLSSVWYAKTAFDRLVLDSPRLGSFRSSTASATPAENERVTERARDAIRLMGEAFAPASRTGRNR